MRTERCGGYCLLCSKRLLSWLKYWEVAVNVHDEVFGSLT